MKVSQALCEEFLAFHPVDAARVAETLEERELGRFLSSMNPPAAAALVSRLSAHIAAACLSRMTPRVAGEICSSLNIELRSRLLRHLPERVRNRILAVLTPEEARLARRLLSLPPGTAAELMDPTVFALPEDITVGEGLQRASRTARGVRRYVYVLNRDHHLVGVVTLPELLQAPNNRVVGSVMRREVQWLRADMAHRDIVNSPYWLELTALPVIDDDGTFLGIVDHRSLARIRAELSRAAPTSDMWETAVALGDLYWWGLAGVMDDLARHAEPTNDARGT